MVAQKEEVVYNYHKLPKEIEDEQKAEDALEDNRKEMRQEDEHLWDKEKNIGIK